MTDKLKTHEYMERRKEERREHKPVHDEKQIRREMGWDLIEQRRIEQERARLRK